MTTPSKTKSCFKQGLSKIDARSLRENNQQKCIDCLKPRSNKNECECKKCGWDCLYVPVIKDFYLYYCSRQTFCNV